MLTAAGGQDTHNIPFDNLQERLLDTLPADIPCDGRTGALLRVLVDFIQDNDAMLGFLNILVASPEEAGDTVFDIRADIAACRYLRAVLDIAGNLHIVGDALD